MNPTSSNSIWGADDWISAFIRFFTSCCIEIPRTSRSIFSTIPNRTIPSLSCFSKITRKWCICSEKLWFQIDYREWFSCGFSAVSKPKHQQLNCYARKLEFGVAVRWPFCRTPTAKSGWRWAATFQCPVDLPPKTRLVFGPHIGRRSIPVRLTVLCWVGPVQEAACTI